MYDFESVLRKWLSKNNPKTILEYGPGFSTKVMIEECPSAKITSIEHDKKWFLKAKKQFSNNINLILKESRNRKSHYACWPLMQDEVPKYDLIFIDGRRRVECLLVGLHVLKKDGIVILHDAERKEYQHGISLYNMIEAEGRTIVLSNK
jgi:predicted O-methyltransferase YrrM